MAIPRTDAQMRAAEMVKIQCGRRELAMEEADYRAVLRRAGGANSSKDLDKRGRLGVLEELRRLGATFRPKPKADAAPEKSDWGWVFKCPPDRQIHLRKIYRLAQRAGTIQTPPVPVASKAYVEGILRQATGMASPETREALRVDLRLASPEALHLVVQILETELRKRDA